MWVSSGWQRSLLCSLASRLPSEVSRCRAHLGFPGRLAPAGPGRAALGALRDQGSGARPWAWPLDQRVMVFPTLDSPRPSVGGPECPAQSSTPPVAVGEDAPPAGAHRGVRLMPVPSPHPVPALRGALHGEG